MTYTYTIMLKSNGKWLLRSLLNNLGEFSSRKEAEAALALIITPQEFHYDEKGVLVG